MKSTLLHLAIGQVDLMFVSFRQKIFFYYPLLILILTPLYFSFFLFIKKKQKTTKTQTKNTRPLRTEQLYSQDGLKNFSHLFNIRFGAMMDIGAKRPTAMHQTVNPTAKPIKHATILADNGISYDNPMLPSQLAARRAERIALDKKKQQAQQQAQAASAVCESLLISVYTHCRLILRCCTSSFSRMPN